MIPQHRLANYWILGIGFGFAAAVQPGPFQAYLIGQTLKNGWRRTLLAALAPLLSDGPIITLVLLVLNQIPAPLRRFLYLAGGVFVLYLAWGAFRAWQRFKPDASASPDSASHSLLRAALTNTLSPGPYIYWSLVTGPILLRGWAETPTRGLGFLAGFYGAMIITLMGLILLFGTARRLGPQVNRALLGVSALALAGFGGYQLWLGVSSQ
ncbi:MAG: hypothetical protein AUK03_14605 [Anaerolineae bacterium CG2_30_64_16]|nr:MAG: hypothetical protein AUK03_14605 [Anaerolineae bacterium CG2_30_64_16]